MKIFDPVQTKAALPYDRLVPAVAQAMRERARSLIFAPDRQVVEIDKNSVFLGMPAISADISVVKLLTVHANNAANNLPAIQGEVIVFESKTGRRLALLDGPTVTARRTAAVSLVGIERLAAKSPQSVLIIGTGVQARAHVEALIDYFGVSRFTVAGSSESRARAFTDSLTGHYPGEFIPMSVASLEQQVLDVDVAIALTSARSPVVPANLAGRTLVIGVGAFKKEMAEIPPELLHKRQVYVDDYEGARHEAGDLIQAGVNWDQVRELGKWLDEELVPGQAAPIFKTVGQATWDLAAARVAVTAL